MFTLSILDKPAFEGRAVLGFQDVATRIAGRASTRLCFINRWSRTAVFAIDIFAGSTRGTDGVARTLQFEAGGSPLFRQMPIS
ncbi:hypothetical protein ACLB6G_07305 [Zhengella sp. ZM62]|uniref:hypothetical protein n=1 Tax=Zhengella sedimenti TaxID=3390035 RepID=UPI003976AB59